MSVDRILESAASRGGGLFWGGGTCLVPGGEVSGPGGVWSGGGCLLLRGCLLLGGWGVSGPGVFVPGLVGCVSAPKGVSGLGGGVPGQVLPPPVNRMNDRQV